MVRMTAWMAKMRCIVLSTTVPCPQEAIHQASTIRVRKLWDVVYSASLMHLSIMIALRKNVAKLGGTEIGRVCITQTKTSFGPKYFFHVAVYLKYLGAMFICVKGAKLPHTIPYYSLHKTALKKFSLQSKVYQIGVIFCQLRIL